MPNIGCSTRSTGAQTRGEVTQLISREQIAAAAERLGPVVRRTPVIASRVLSERIGQQVYFKCEKNLQRTGSFKPRGAYNRIANLSRDERERGVVAASAGNHAQGVAWAATELGIASTVFMPVNVALPKLVATKAYGAQVHLAGETIDDAWSLPASTPNTTEQS